MKYSLLKMLFVTIIVLSAYGGFASSLFYYLNEPDDTYISNSMLSDSQKNADLLLVNNFISNLKNSPLNKDNNKLIIDDSINQHKRFVQQGLFTPPKNDSSPLFTLEVAFVLGDYPKELCDRAIEFVQSKTEQCPEKTINMLTLYANVEPERWDGINDLLSSLGLADDFKKNEGLACILGQLQWGTDDVTQLWNDFLQIQDRVEKMTNYQEPALTVVVLNNLDTVEKRISFVRFMDILMKNKVEDKRYKVEVVLLNLVTLLQFSELDLSRQNILCVLLDSFNFDQFSKFRKFTNILSMTKAMDFYNEGAEINEEMQGSFDTYFENFENIYEALEKLNSATQLRAPKLKEIEQYIYINTAYLNRSEVNNFDPRVRFFRQKAEIRLLKCLDEF